MKPTSFLPWLCLCAALAAAPASARPLALPIRDPRSLALGPRVAAPAYAGDVLEVRLTPPAAALARAGGIARGRASRLSVATLDQLASRYPGLTFEPEFRGETPPAPGSGDTDFTAFYVVHLPLGLPLTEALDRFAALADVASATPIAILPVSAAPNDSLYPQSYWFHQPSGRDLHAEQAWNLTTGDTSIVVAILDTGVLPYHPDLGGSTPGLSGQIWTNWAERAGVPGVDDDGNGFIDDVHGWDFVSLASSTEAENGEDWQDQDNDPNDFAGHGTAVAGLVGAITDNVHGVSGTAWHVRLMPLRMGFAYAGAPLGDGEVRMDFAAQSIRYATRMGANVINCSWESIDQDGLGAAVTAAIRAGISVVVAGGPTGSFDYLARREDVVSVSVTDQIDLLASFSNFAPYLDLAAPGVNVASTTLIHLTSDSLGARVPTYRTNLNGSSFSAPLVSGAIALMQADRRAQALPLLDPMSVLLRLRETTDDIAADNPGSLGLYGTGRLNVLRALTETSGSHAIRAGGKSIGAPLVLRTNGSDARIAFVTDSGHLVIVDGATQDTVVVAPLGGVPARGPAGADLGGGHGVGLFVGLTNGTMVGLDLTGAALPGWPRSVSPTSSLLGGPALGDLDGDGVLEVVCATLNGRIYAWHADGTPVTGFPIAPGAGAIKAPIALSPLDAGPSAEIIVAGQNGDVYAFDGSGGVLPGWPVTLSGLPSAPSVGPTGSSAEPTVWIAAGVELHALDSTGLERPGFPTLLAGTAALEFDVALADLDLDGSREAIVVTTAPDQVEVRDSLGTSLAALNWPRALPGVGGTPVAGDLVAGPAPELLLRAGTGLLELSSAADSLGTFPKPGLAGAFPSLGQVDGDPAIEVAAGTGPDSVFYLYDSGSRAAGVRVLAWPTYRANGARTGSVFYSPGMFAVDVVPPNPIADLSAGTLTTSSVQLLWTAPSDIGLLGRPSSYEIRRSTSPLNESNFGSGTLVPGAPTPGTPGTAEAFVAGALAAGQSYYFAIRSLDAAGNTSAISNVLTATTQVDVAPAAITDLRVTATTDTSITLQWTAVGEHGNVGRPDRYLVRAAETAMNDTVFTAATLERQHPATVDAGGTETQVFDLLQPAHHYWFGVKALGVSLQLSALSNVVTATTKAGGPLDGRDGIALVSAVQPSRTPVRIFWQSAPGGENGPQTIQMFDLQGRVRATLGVGPGPAGVVTWDGRDTDGNRVPAGLYFARLSSGSVHATTRIVLLP